MPAAGSDPAATGSKRFAWLDYGLGVGDVDGDGLSDFLLVGTRNAYLVSGRDLQSLGDSVNFDYDSVPAHSWRLTFQDRNIQFNETASLADLDGDGSPELVLPAYSYSEDARRRLKLRHLDRGNWQRWIFRTARQTASSTSIESPAAGPTNPGERTWEAGLPALHAGSFRSARLYADAHGTSLGTRASRPRRGRDALAYAYPESAMGYRMQYGRIAAMLALGAMIAACDDRQAGAPGLEVDEPADYYFRTADGDLKRGPVVWSGMCVGGMAEGPGVLDQPSDYEYPFEYTQEGLLQDGRKHGSWIENSPWGRVTEASYANGKRHGKWLGRNRSGKVVRQYHYVNDKRDGSYVNGLRNGEWIVRHVEGAILAKGSYENDIPQGLWTYRYRDGSVSQGAYLAGRRVGVWTVSNSGIRVGTLNYARRREGKVVDGGPLMVRVEGRCGDLPLGFPCWEELESPSGCYSWNMGLEPRVYVSGSLLSWTGECANGIAEGEGTLTEETATRTSENLWRLNEGYQASVLKSANARASVFQANPPMQTYLERTRKRSEKGSLVAGLRNGEWTVSDKTGHVISRGPFLNDQAHGDWTYWYRNGFTAEGAFQHGERTGAWTVRDPEGNVSTVDYETSQR